MSTARSRTRGSPQPARLAGRVAAAACCLRRSAGGLLALFETVPERISIVPARLKLGSGGSVDSAKT